MSAIPPKATGETLSNAFATALLLTGSERMAEEAVLGAIDSVDVSLTSSDELLQRLVEESIQPGRSSDSVQGLLEDCPEYLPVELRDVLALEDDLRQSFVLRVLLALPRERCGRLLNLRIGEIAARTGLAAARLAGARATRDGEHARMLNTPKVAATSGSIL